MNKLTAKEKEQKGILKDIDNLRERIAELRLCALKAHEDVGRAYRKAKAKLQADKETEETNVAEVYQPFIQECWDELTVLEADLEDVNKRGEVDE